MANLSTIPRKKDGLQQGNTSEEVVQYMQYMNEKSSLKQYAESYLQGHNDA
jgi:hypothetical protein